MVSSQLKIYAIVAGIFVLGASAGGAAGYAVASQRLAAVLGDERPDALNARRFEALSSELELTGEQRQQVRAIMERHKGENRRLTRALFEKCGDELEELRSQVDGEIRGVLNEQQQQRFGELMEKRKHRFPLGGPGGRFRKGSGAHD